MKRVRIHRQRRWLACFLIVVLGLLSVVPSSAAQQILDGSGIVRAVSCDNAGNCWLATWGGVSLHTAAGAWVSFTSGNSGLAHDYCHDVAVDQAGMVWIGHHYTGGLDLLDTRGTLTNLSDDRWLNFDEDDGLASGHSWVEEVYVDNSNRKWFGHAAGVSVLNDGGTPFTKHDDTGTTYNSGNSTLDPGFVNAVLEDGSGCIWVGTEYNLSRTCGGGWTEYS